VAININCCAKEFYIVWFANKNVRRPEQSDYISSIESISMFRLN